MSSRRDDDYAAGRRRKEELLELEPASGEELELAEDPGERQRQGTLHRPRRHHGRRVLRALVLLALLAAAYFGWRHRERLLGLGQRLLGQGEVQVLLELEPANARVYLDGAQILNNPIVLQRSDLSFELTVRAPGHHPSRLRFRADHDQGFRIVLRRTGKRRRAQRSRRSGRTAEARCPAGMRRIPGADGGDAFCIDRHEHPGRGKAPTRGLSLAGARAACHARGKRLCTVVEWVRACGESRFPYGSRYVPGRCVTGGKQVARAGSRAGCRSRWGVLDLSGNVSEWVDEGVAMGGDASGKGGMVGCRASSDSGGALAGVRCCADPPWD